MEQPQDPPAQPEAPPPAAQPEAPPPAVHPAPAPRATLGVVSLGVALGLANALFVFLIGILSTFFDWGVGIVAVLATFYVGYSPDIVGSVTGAVWGFVHGFVGGVVIAYLYNRVLSTRR